MAATRRFWSLRPAKHVFVGVVTLFVLLTLSSLADTLLQAGWGLGWRMFFIGFIASAWGIAAYQMCASCFGWAKRRR